YLRSGATLIPWYWVAPSGDPSAAALRPQGGLLSSAFNGVRGSRHGRFPILAGAVLQPIRDDVRSLWRALGEHLQRSTIWIVVAPIADCRSLDTEGFSHRLVWMAIDDETLLARVHVDRGDASCFALQ